jgi:phage/plasmid-associated DNA primase
MFLDQCTDETPGGYLTSAQIYGMYESWCRENGVPAKHQTKFSQSLAGLGYPPKHGRLPNSGKVARFFENIGPKRDNFSANL